jgi:hypothetical protein
MMDKGTDPHDSAVVENRSGESDPMDPREQMREALARKNAKAHAGQAHLEGSAKAGGEHAKAGGTRQFRRKSGG